MSVARTLPGVMTADVKIASLVPENLANPKGLGFAGVWIVKDQNSVTLSMDKSAAGITAIPLPEGAAAMSQQSELGKDHQAAFRSGVMALVWAARVCLCEAFSISSLASKSGMAKLFWRSGRVFRSGLKIETKFEQAENPSF